MAVERRIDRNEVFRLNYIKKGFFFRIKKGNYMVKFMKVERYF